MKGLVARGGFELDITWKDGKVSRLVVKSRLGGNCRLRSLNRLSGKGLAKARGENDNPYFVIDQVAAPLVNKEAKLNPVELKKTYLYDLKTEPGQEYVLIGK